MQKYRGFTLIELLVVITILSILFVITVPNYQRLRDKNTFRSQNQVLWDQIATSRSAALTSKKCNNGDIAIAWQVVVSGVNNSAPITHTFNCINGPDFGTDIYEEEAARTLESTEVLELEIDDTTIVSLATSNVTTLRLNFLSGSAQTRLEQITSGGVVTRINDFRAVFDHTADESVLRQTICLERVGGFPTLNKNGIVCEVDA